MRRPEAGWGEAVFDVLDHRLHAYHLNAFIDMGIVEEPALLSFILTDNTFLGGHPGTMRGLQAHLDFLPPDKRILWSVVDYGGNLLSLAAPIIAAGGHVSIGIGDYTYPELGQPTNVDLVMRVAAIAHDMGREVATPAEAKQMLGRTSKNFARRASLGYVRYILRTPVVKFQCAAEANAKGMQP